MFVDKSLFIKEVIDDLAEVKLIIRPRRFGKILNMSMLHHFFAKEIDTQPTEKLFKDLKISKHIEYLNKYQGRYPVVDITFKDIKSGTFGSAYEYLKKVIGTAYEKHEHRVLWLFSK